MSKVAVVYWSGTGNTEAMANAVAEGAKEKGAEVTLFTASEFSSAKVAEFDGIAFGCPAMGAENLEESEFEPMFTDCEAALSGKKIALFGSVTALCTILCDTVLVKSIIRSGLPIFLPKPLFSLTNTLALQPCCLHIFSY